MGFRICPECGGKVANSIDTCIHCGHRFKDEALRSKISKDEEDQLKLFDYTVSESGYVVITGIKDIYVRNVVIPGFVKVIEGGAFRHKENIESVVIKGNLEFINNHAFDDCKNLSSIMIEAPKSYLIIKENAFNNCKNLKQIIISADRCSVSGYFARYCSNLEKLQINANYALYSDYSITDFPKLEKIDLSNATQLFDYVGGGCTALKSIKLPEGIETIPRGFCARCKSLTDVIIPKTVKRISGDAFRGCENLKYVYYEGKKIDEIEEDAFFGCTNLICCELLKYADKIYDRAFNDCTELDFDDSKVSYISFKSFWGTKYGQRRLEKIRSQYLEKYYGKADNLLCIKNGEAIYLTDIFTKNVPILSNDNSWHKYQDNYSFETTFETTSYVERPEIDVLGGTSFSQYAVYNVNKFNNVTSWIPYTEDLIKYPKDKLLRTDKDGNTCEYLLHDFEYTSYSEYLGQKEESQYDVEGYLTGKVKINKYKCSVTNIYVSKVNKNGEIVKEKLNNNEIGLCRMLRIPHPLFKEGKYTKEEFKMIEDYFNEFSRKP